jgi:hypothetical protein
VSTVHSCLHLDYQELHPPSPAEFSAEQFKEIEEGWLDIVRVAVYRETGYMAASGYIAAL